MGAEGSGPKIGGREAKSGGGNGGAAESSSDSELASAGLLCPVRRLALSRRLASAGVGWALWSGSSSGQTSSRVHRSSCCQSWDFSLAPIIGFNTIVTQMAPERRTRQLIMGEAMW